MNKRISKQILTGMITGLIGLQMCTGVYAQDTDYGSVDTAIIEDTDYGSVDTAIIEDMDYGIVDTMIIEEPVVQEEEIDAPAQEMAGTEASEAVSESGEEPAPQPAASQNTGTEPESIVQNEYDVEGISSSELESYLYEMGMEEYAGSISDESESEAGNYTWGLNTLTREPAQLNGYNFVIFGLSGENSGDDGRSDTIMICTIDPDREEIKLTSILRDTKAAIEGHEPQKINAAHMIGGPELAIATLNNNFGLTLENYITVQFDTLIDMIDILGGIEIELTGDEADFINTYSVEYGYDMLSAGVQVLDGWQTVLYCRIRKIDSDSVRDSRQQLVIQKIFETMRGSSFFKWIEIIMKALETSEISMSLADILKVVSLPLGEYTLVKNVIPDIHYETDLKTAIDEHGEWVWLYDLGKAGDRIVDIINQQ